MPARLHPDGGVPLPEAAFDLDEGLQQGDASPGAVAPALDAEAAFVLDAGPIQQDARDGAPADADLQEAQGAATKDGADDGGTPCDTLMRCCPNLLGPALLICAAGAQQADGGDAGSCESLLAGFRGAGLCP